MTAEEVQRAERTVRVPGTRWIARRDGRGPGRRGLHAPAAHRGRPRARTHRRRHRPVAHDARPAQRPAAAGVRRGLARSCTGRCAGSASSGPSPGPWPPSPPAARSASVPGLPELWVGTAVAGAGIAVCNVLIPVVHPARLPAPGAADDRGLLRHHGHRRRAGLRRVPAAVPPVRELAPVARRSGPSRPRSRARGLAAAPVPGHPEPEPDREDPTPVWRSVARLAADRGHGPAVDDLLHHGRLAALDRDQPWRLGRARRLVPVRVPGDRHPRRPRAAGRPAPGRYAAGRHPGLPPRWWSPAWGSSRSRPRCRPGCCWPGSAPAPRWCTR